MRGGGGGGGGMNNSVDTVNAAATAIVSAEARVQQVTSPRRRWGSCFNMYWCFGSQRSEKRIGHAVVIPETTPAGSVHAASESQILSSPVVLPFIAPPSSPASFLQSEPPSVSHSPVGLFSLSALSAEVYSPGGPASMFAIGPYAHETQLVSPPVLSTLTTEPSTAPLTPPEPVHFTTPSSPEVPFAQLLMSSLDSNLKKGEGFGFQSYQLYHPGSPIGNLISPSSVCSGTSSPLPDPEFNTCVTLPAFPTCDPPKLVNSEELAVRRKIPIGATRRDGLLAREQIPLSKAVDNAITNSCSGNVVMDNRISFELAAKKLEFLAEKEGDPYRVSLDHHLKKTEAAAESCKPTVEGTDHSRSSSLTFDNRFVLASAAEQLESFVDKKEALFRVSPDNRLNKMEPAAESGEPVEDDTMNAGHSQSGNAVMGNRRTFELAARKLECLVESRGDDPYRVSLDHLNRTEPAAEPKQEAGEADKIVGCYVDETYHDLPGKLKRSISDLGSKEFKFRDADGAPAEPTVGLDWWVKEKVTGTTEMVGSKNWAFFPIAQPGVS